MTLLLPEPLGPTMAEKDLWKGPIVWLPAYDCERRDETEQENDACDAQLAQRYSP